MQIRRLPKLVIAMVLLSLLFAFSYFYTLSYRLNLLSLFTIQVAGYAVGGGHVLHMVCDITITTEMRYLGRQGPSLFSAGLFCILVYRMHIIPNTDKVK